MAIKKKKTVTKAKKVTKPAAKKKAAGAPVKRTVVKKAPAKPAAVTTAYDKLQLIGEVTHYFPHVSAGIIKLLGELKVGDTVNIKGHTTDFKQTVDSIQIEHTIVTEAKKGQEIGLKVKDRVRIGDAVYKI